MDLNYHSRIVYENYIIKSAFGPVMVLEGTCSGPMAQILQRPAIQPLTRKKASMEPLSDLGAQLSW